eukprot:3556563-Pleurochrysis_carterae.AAC.1
MLQYEYAEGGARPKWRATRTCTFLHLTQFLPTASDELLDHVCSTPHSATPSPSAPALSHAIPQIPVTPVVLKARRVRIDAQECVRAASPSTRRGFSAERAL